MGGWMTQIDREWLAEFFSTLKFDYPPVITEVGVFCGGCSLIFWRSFTNCVFHAVDNWSEGPPPEGKTLREGFMGTLDWYKKEIDENVNVTIHDGDSKTVGADWSIMSDICLVDACHHGDYPMKDIENFGRCVKVGGYLLVDDSQMTDVMAAVDALLSNNTKWESIPKPMGEVLTWKKISD